MVMDERWADLINKFLDMRDKKLMDIYFSLRLMFIREGWSEKDLENVPYYPQDIMSGFQKYSDEKKNYSLKLRHFLISTLINLRLSSNKDF